MIETHMGLKNCTFEVSGIPAPQGSKRAFKNRHTGKVSLVEMSKKVAPWRKAVKTAAEQIDIEPFTGPTGIHITFYLPRPKTVRRIWPSVKPDVDKLVRSTLDALTQSGIITDDAIICNQHATKVYETADAAPGALIRLWDMGDNTPAPKPRKTPAAKTHPRYCPLHEFQPARTCPSCHGDYLATGTWPEGTHHKNATRKDTHR